MGEEGGGSEDSDEPPSADDTQTLRCTTEHPFWVRGKGWVEADDLRVGDRLLGSQGEDLVVTSHQIKAEEADHYNFEVEGWHTYFVAETEDNPAVWVHNTCDVHLDVGGEGRHAGAINLNPGHTTTTTGTPGRPIPNHVQGRGEQMPFASNSADRITVESAPLRPAGFPDRLGQPTPGTASEIGRVIKPGGEVRLSHPPGPQGAGAHADVVQATGGNVAHQATDQHGITTTIIRVP